MSETENEAALLPVRSNAGLGDSSQYADEWEAFCKADYEAYKEKHPQPFVAHFWSGSAFYDSLEDWGREWDRRCRIIGEKWWRERGFTITIYPRQGGITVSPNE